MNFEDLKEQLKELGQRIWGELQENPTFHNLQEQFYNLNPIAQKSILAGVGALVGLLILSLPLSYLQDAHSNIQRFDESRNLTKDLLKAVSSSKGPNPLGPGMSESQLRSRVESVLNRAKLSEGQVGSLTPAPVKFPGVPEAIKQIGIRVPVESLNIKQVIDLGHSLQSLGEGVKLSGLDIKATTEDDHYYNVVYTLVNFSTPAVEESGGDNAKPAPSGRGRTRGRPTPSNTTRSRRGGS